MQLQFEREYYTVLVLQSRHFSPIPDHPPFRYVDKLPILTVLRRFVPRLASLYRILISHWSGLRISAISGGAPVHLSFTFCHTLSWHVAYLQQRMLHSVRKLLLRSCGPPLGDKLRPLTQVV